MSRADTQSTWVVGMASWKGVALGALKGLQGGELASPVGSPTPRPPASISVRPSIALQGRGEIDRIKIISQSRNQKPLSGQDKTKAISCLYL